MQRLEVVHQQSEALLIQSFLKAQGIDCNVVGARDYSAIVAGGTQGRYNLMVPEDRLEDARSLLREMRVREAGSDPQTEVPAPNHLRKAVFFAFAAAFILPIIFNYASVTHARLYWQKSAKDWRAQVSLLIIGILQLPPLILALYILRSYLNS